MNYTENYHLPQWEKEDRVLMEDFNQMCADIESGLTDVNQSASNNTGIAWNGIVQAAWNLMAARYEAADQSKIDSFQGLTINPLTSMAMASTLTGATWLAETGVYIGIPPALPDTLLRETCTGSSNGLANFTSASDKYKSATYGFISPITGSITMFRLFYQLALGAGQTYTGKLDFKAEEKNGSSWRTVYTKSGLPLEKYVSGADLENRDVSVNVPITEGKEYRLSLTLVAGENRIGSFGFVQGSAGVDNEDSSVIAIQRTVSQAGSHTKTLPIGGNATRALVMAFYQMDQSGGTISAAVNSKALTKISDGEAKDQTGRSCRRACFLATGSYQNTAAVRLSMTCQSSNTLRLLSYAVLFL